MRLQGMMLATFMVLCSVVSCGFLKYNSVDAASPQEYTWGYNLTNLYTDYTLTYEFAGLDAGIEYSFNLQ